MSSKSLIAALALLLALGSCAPKKAAPGPVQRPFPSVEIPALLEDPQDRLSYAGRSFWDAFLREEGDFICDSTHVGGVPVGEVESQVGLYVTLLERLPLSEGRSDLSALCDKLRQSDSLSNISSELFRLLEKYLYDPNSPLRNEDLWEVCANALAHSPRSADMAEVYAFQARTCALNRTGTPAADFVFTDASGRRRSLYSVKAPLTLLFFSNPGCPACREIVDALVQMGPDPSDLAVVNVYIDEDLEAWREHLGDYPASWFTGYDAEGLIRSDLVYNVRAIPSLYLLDEDKTVLLKDCTPENLFSALNEIL